MRIGGYISPIVIEQITLNVCFPSPIEIREFVGPEIGIISLNAGSFPTWRALVAASDDRFARNASSFAVPPRD